MEKHKRRWTASIFQKRQSHKASFWFSAFHEVGHAVMAHHEGLAVMDVTISGDLSGLFRCRFPADESGVPLDIPKQIRVLLAGPFVQKWASESYPEDIDLEDKKKYLNGGWADDMREVDILGKKLNPPDGLSESDLQPYWVDVENILKPYAHIFYELAIKLWKTGVLSSDEIKAAIETQEQQRIKP
jgi:hypothetical protein